MIFPKKVCSAVKIKQTLSFATLKTLIDYEQSLKTKNVEKKKQEFSDRREKKKKNEIHCKIMKKYRA